MKWNYGWFAVVIAALVAGYTGGRVHDQVVAEQKRGDEVARNHPSGDEGRGARRSSTRSLRQNVGRKNRARQIETLLNEFAPGNGDAYISYIGDSNPMWSRLCAHVMQLSHSDFPQSMKLLERVSGENEDDPFGDGSNQSKFRELLLQRWAELDPAAASQWVDEQTSGKSEAELLTLQLFIAQEAVQYYPEWAIEHVKKTSLLLRAYREKDAADRDDPFWEYNLDSDLDMVFWRLSAFPEAQRNALIKQIPTELLDEGIQGWTSGLLVHGDEDTFLTVYQNLEKSDDGYYAMAAFSMLASNDWKYAKSVVERHQAYDADEYVWENWSKEDKGSADQWFIDRAQDKAEQEERISRIADSILGSDQQLRWVEGMAAEGYPVADAWAQVVTEFKSEGRLDEALQYLDRTPEDDRLRLRNEIFDKASDKNWFSGHGDASTYYIIPHEKYRSFYQNNEEYRTYVIEMNNRALQSFHAMIRYAMEEIGQE